MKLDAIGGIHAVEATLSSAPKTVRQLLVANSRDKRRLTPIMQLARRHNVPVEPLDGREIDRRYPDLRHQGIVALCREIEPLSENAMLALLAGLQRPGFVLLLDGVTDPHNLGAVLRSADAAGVDCVIAPRDGSVGITPVVRKVASGAASSVPFCRVTNLARTLDELKGLGYWIYGAADSADQLYTTPDYLGPVALVLGAEGAGMRRLTRQRCDATIGIPMAGTVSSLNVSVAAAVCLFEVVRQRRLAAGPEQR